MYSCFQFDASYSLPSPYFTCPPPPPPLLLNNILFRHSLGRRSFGSCMWRILFSFPFGIRNNECGDPHFYLYYDPFNDPYYPLLNISGGEYYILKPSLLANNGSHKITIVNENLWGNNCSILGNYTEPWWYGSNPFYMAQGYTNLTLWKDYDPSSEKNYEFPPSLKLCGNFWYYSFDADNDLKAGHCKMHLQLPIKKFLLSQLFTNHNF